MKLGNTGASDLDNYTDLRISKQIRPKSGGSMFFGEIKNYVGKLKEATAFKYFGDGTGRD